jgi:tetratricopeptide (TPR) repeat protein
MNETCEKRTGFIETIKSKKVPPELIVFLLAIFVRALYLYDSRSNPTFYAPVVDSMTYDLLARDFAKGAAMSEKFFWQPFFYPVFLSAVYFFCNCSILCAKLVQILLGATTCVLTYRLGKRLFGQSAGFLASCLAALYGPLIFFECELLAAGWATFWAVTLILLFLNAAESNRPHLYFILGICGGMSILNRPDFIPFFAAACLWLTILWIKKSIAAKGIVLKLAAIAAGFLLAVVPVAAQNYRITKHLSFLPTTGGLNLYLGNNPDFEAASVRPGIQWQKIVDQPVRLGLHTPARQQHFFYAESFQYIRTQPANFIRGILHKTLEFTSSREMPGNIDIYLFTKWSPLLGLLVWKVDGFGFPFGTLLPLAILGIFFYRRTIPAPVILFCVFCPLLIILTHIEARYRVPVVVPMCVLAAGGLIRVGEMVRMKSWYEAAVVGIFIAAAAFLCSAAGPFYSERNINYQAELYYGLGGSLEKRGQTENAVESYSKAIALDSNYVEAYHNLGLLLAKQNRFEQAIANYNTGLKLDPQYAPLLRDLGLGLFKQGKTKEALECYYKAVQIDPIDAKSYEYLAFALQSEGKTDEAIRYYNRSLEIDPANAEAHYNLGAVLQSQGRPEEAAKHYAEALRIKPDFVDARSNLGVLLAGAGKFDEAIVNFTEALRIKPNSAGLQYNLAIALDSQGRSKEALIHYHRALELASAENNQQLAGQIRKKLELYSQPGPN